MSTKRCEGSGREVCRIELSPTKTPPGTHHRRGASLSSLRRIGRLATTNPLKRDGTKDRPFSAVLGLRRQFAQRSCAGSGTPTQGHRRNAGQGRSRRQTRQFTTSSASTSPITKTGECTSPQVHRYSGIVSGGDFNRTHTNAARNPSASMTANTTNESHSPAHHTATLRDSLREALQPLLRLALARAVRSCRRCTSGLVAASRRPSRMRWEGSSTPGFGGDHVGDVTALACVPSFGQLGAWRTHPLRRAFGLVGPRLRVAR